MAIWNYLPFFMVTNKSDGTVVTKIFNLVKLLKPFFSFCFSVVKTACERIKKPITCKIRVYDTVEKTVEYVKRLEKAGAKVSILLRGTYTSVLCFWCKQLNFHNERAIHCVTIVRIRSFLVRIFFHSGQTNSKNGHFSRAD